jgi:hypothetical protein
LNKEKEFETKEIEKKPKLVEKAEFAEIKSGENFIKIRKNQDDIEWAISILSGMLQGYFGGKSKKLWK